MTEKTEPQIGAIEWRDLTVENAEEVKDFYAAVVGWEPDAVSMGDYDDFNMLMPGTSEPAGGVCHARGSNAGLPAQWLMYVRVADVNASIEACTARGGCLVAGPNSWGNSLICVIEDPAGAVLALISG